MTGEDFGYQQSVIEQRKFEYSPFGKVLTKGLDKDDQKIGLFKRLKNIEDKNKETLEKIKNQKTKKLGNKNSQAANQGRS